MILGIVIAAFKGCIKVNYYYHYYYSNICFPHPYMTISFIVKWRKNCDNISRPNGLALPETLKWQLVKKFFMRLPNLINIIKHCCWKY